MLELTIATGQEGWDEVNEVFVEPKTQTIQLEHSLVSIQKWESKWHKPFLSRTEKTREEVIDYIKFMTLTKNVSDELYRFLTSEHIKQVEQYINEPMTAATFSKNQGGRGSSEFTSAETIYYWMIENGIDYECRKWHFNQLMTLIRFCSAKSKPGKKMSSKESARQYAAMNAARRQKFNSRG